MKSNPSSTYQLIQRLTPAEQRTFHHLAHRHTHQRSMAYYNLYEILRKQPVCDEEVARETMALSKPHFSVIKRQLFDHLLSALAYHHRQSHDLETGRRLLQQTRLLLEKGLNELAAKRHRKAKRLIEDHQLLELQTECLMLQRDLLEQRINQTDAAQDINQLEQDWAAATTALQQAGTAACSSLKVAHQHHRKVRSHSPPGQQSNIPDLQKEPFKDLLQAAQWTTKLDARRALSTFHFMNAAPARAFTHNQALLQLFRDAPFLTERYPARFLTVFQNLLIDHFQLQHWAEVERGLQQLRELPRQKAFRRLQGIEQRIIERSTLLEVNMLVARKSYARGHQLASTLVPKLEEQTLRLSYPNQQSLLYLLAICQWLNGAADTAQVTLNLFLNRYRKKTLEELYHFARLLQLAIHYDQKHFDLLPYLIKAFRRSHEGFYPKSTVLLLQYLQQLIKAPGATEQRQLLKDWRDKIEKGKLPEKESRFYEYLDLIYWIKSSES